MNKEDLLVDPGGTYRCPVCGVTAIYSFDGITHGCTECEDNWEQAEYNDHLND